MQLLDHDGLRAKGIKLSKVQIWRLTRVGKFPRPLKIGESRNAWIESEVDDWIRARVAERDAKAA